MAFNGKVKVTSKIFDAVKILLNNGATYEECSKYMSISVVTVGRIKRAETFEEYKSISLEENRKYRAVAKKAAVKAQEEANKKAAEATKEMDKEPKVQIIEHRQTVQIQATHYMMEEMRKTNELLTIISNKLAFIVDELTK